ncbi:MAG: hypothetical protein NC337_08245 [Roseburia sp.]|nr:hypothetical protein [Roseburia sp.]
MKLREIDLDMPYEKNEERIQQIQEKNGISREEAVKLDYELHWKKKRNQFRLKTRCMTAMIERIMEPVNTDDCWKILFECHKEEDESKEDDDIKNLLGVYAVRTRFNFEEFWESDSCGKKKMVIETIAVTVKKYKNNISFNLEGICAACEQITALGYVNEWIWRKTLKLGKKQVRIQMRHEVEEMDIYMVFLNDDKQICNRILLVRAVPDEWNYSEYLGKLERVSDDSAALVTKNGERLIGICKPD